MWFWATGLVVASAVANRSFVPTTAPVSPISYWTTWCKFSQCAAKSNPQSCVFASKGSWQTPASVFVKLPATRCPHVNFACMCHTDVQNYPTNSPGGNKAMGDTQLFAKTPVPGCPGCGWATHFFPDARADMLLVLDDTWFIKPSFFENQWLLDPALVSQLGGMHSSVRPWH